MQRSKRAQDGCLRFVDLFRDELGQMFVTMFECALVVRNKFYLQPVFEKDEFCDNFKITV